MTEAQHIAAETWLLVRMRNMPRGVALDRVQDVTGDRPEALRLLFAAAINYAIDRRHSGRNYNEVFRRSQIVVEAMANDDWAIAEATRHMMTPKSRRFYGDEFQFWADWWHEMKMVIRLCRELDAAAVAI